MSAAELRLSYRLNDERHGQLDAVVTSRAFFGRGSAWFSRDKLKDTFIVALREFPLSASNPPLVEGGFWSKAKPGTLEQCHLRVIVRPHDARGSLLVQVDLATESWGTPDKDQQQCVTARFLTGYADIEAFASQLEQISMGN
jgi:hypothetical protein